MRKIKAQNIKHVCKNDFDQCFSIGYVQLKYFLICSDLGSKNSSLKELWQILRSEKTDSLFLKIDTTLNIHICLLTTNAPGALYLVLSMYL